MKTLLLLVFLGPAVAAPTDRDVMMGGSECSKHAAPWTVSLNIGHYTCSGALIHPRWVVSAANCYHSHMQVRLGQHDITATEGSGQLIDAEMVIRHPKHDYYTRANNIMLIKLSRPAAMNRNVSAVPLPTQCAQTGDMCLISARGRTWNPPVRGHQLKCLDSPVLRDTDCHGSYPRMTADNMICLACLQVDNRLTLVDSGRPVVCYGVLQGVGSRVYGCKMGQYGLYTRVCSYASWIHNTIAAN